MAEYGKEIWKEEEGGGSGALSCEGTLSFSI